MKKNIAIVFLTIITLRSGVLKAQDVYETNQTFMILGAGINNSCGLFGIGLEQFITGQGSAIGAVGLGTWGYKITGGLRYYLDDSKTGNAFGLSYSLATGIKEVELDVDVNIGGVERKVKDKFELNPTSVINLTWMRHWSIGKKSRLNLELGYSVNISGQDNFNSASKPFMTSTSKNALNFIQPGGLIIGLAFSLGL